MLLLTCSNQAIIPIIRILKSILFIIQILIPIGLIIMGTIDLGRAVIAGDEKQIKEHQQRLLKRCLAAVLVFLITTIVTFLMSFVGGTGWSDCWSQATSCPNGINPDTGDCK